MLSYRALGRSWSTCQNVCSRRSRFTSGTPNTASVTGDAEPHEPRTSLLAELTDEPGALYHLLSCFWRHAVNCTQIESRPGPSQHTLTVQVSFEGRRGDPAIDKLLGDLKKQARNILVLDDKVLPWFPRHISDLDKMISNRGVVDLIGDETQLKLAADHPGFTDPTYRERRRQLCSIAQSYAHSDDIPRIEYTAAETDTWGHVYRQMASFREHACREYRQIIPMMERHCGFGTERIPQAQDISDFLQAKTGWRLRPVAGLLSSRDFLNGLAFRVFFSTQYIRHGSRPLYTPEPDICHELLGHAPMFADGDFAAFSQEIGLASLGASDHDVRRLATCYWHSVEFGLLREDGRLKAYGAGVLSSYGEMAHALGLPDGNGNVGGPIYCPWDPAAASERQDYPLSSYQDVYYVAASLAEAKVSMRRFTEEAMPKPFRARYNPHDQSIWLDRAVATADLDAADV